MKSIRNNSIQITISQTGKHFFRFMLLLITGLFVLAGFTGCATTEAPPPPEDIGMRMQEPVFRVPRMLTIQIYYQATGLHADAKELIDEYLSNIDYPERLEFIVEGYTCTEGDRDYNKMLSAWRAGAVKRHMVSRGIDASSVAVIGHGVRNPVASNRTQAGRVKNRRVTISARKAY